MRPSGPWQLAVVCLALGQPAAAQVIWDVPNIVEKKPKFDRSTVPSRANIWPRLDPGAVFCRTEGDLQRLVASRRGQTGDRPNCQLIQTPTPITILKRAGLGQTQVALTDQNGQEGWTDAWLPDRPPPYAGKGVQIR